MEYFAVLVLLELPFPELLLHFKRNDTAPSPLKTNTKKKKKKETRKKKTDGKIKSCMAEAILFIRALQQFNML